MKSRRCLSLILFTTILLGVVASQVSADRKRLLKPSEKSKDNKSVAIRYDKYMVTGMFALGKLTGEVTKEVDGTKHELVYGFGGGLEYFPKPKLGVGIESRLHWASPSEGGPSVRGTEFRPIVLYRFSPASRRTMYLKSGLGVITGSTEGYESSTRTQFRIGLGVLSFGTGTLNTRIELSYNRLLHREGEIRYWGRMLDYDVSYVILDFGFGIPL